jgi:hypothetical protein
MVKTDLVNKARDCRGPVVATAVCIEEYSFGIYFSHSSGTGGGAEPSADRDFANIDRGNKARDRGRGPSGTGVKTVVSGAGAGVATLAAGVGADARCELGP